MVIGGWINLKLTLINSTDGHPPRLNLFRVERDSLFDLAINLNILMWISIYVLIQRKVNALSLAEANLFQNYVYMYIYHFGIHPMTKFIVLFAYYVRHINMMKKITNVLKGKYFGN